MLPVVVHALPWLSRGHCSAAHEFAPLHVTSHLHELRQSTWAHVLAPLQVTVHAVPVAHVTLAQLLACPQSTAQLQPAGQVAAPNGSTIVHVICAVLHDVHAAGQLLLPAPSVNTQ